MREFVTVTVTVDAPSGVLGLGFVARGRRRLRVLRERRRRDKAAERRGNATAKVRLVMNLLLPAR